MAYYVERCGGGLEERAELRINPAGEVTVLIGTQSNGQGHETAYAQIVEDKLGIPFENVRVIQGDTDVIATGRGTGGSRSLPVGGNAVVHASERIIAKCKRIAADMLEAAEADIEFKDGTFAIAGTDRKLAILDVIKRAYTAQGLPEDMEPGIDEIGHYLPAGATFPNGCHIVEIEIDSETGTPELMSYVVVDDFGRVINPLLIAGQVHGGVVQGVGQALYEHCVYDPESGQLLSGSFMDYTMPRADHMPPIEFETVEILCKTNPLGIKGSGEAGAIGAPPAVINAVVDALDRARRAPCRHAGDGARALASPAPGQGSVTAARDHATLVEALVALAEVAGAATMPYFRNNVVVEKKADSSPVTAADRAADQRHPDRPRAPGAGHSGDHRRRGRRRPRRRYFGRPVLSRRSARRHQGVHRRARGIHRQHRAHRAGPSGSRRRRRAGLGRDVRGVRAGRGDPTRPEEGRWERRAGRRFARARRRPTDLVALSSRSHAKKEPSSIAISRRCRSRSASSPAARSSSAGSPKDAAISIRASARPMNGTPRPATPC